VSILENTHLRSVNVYDTVYNMNTVINGPTQTQVGGWVNEHGDTESHPVCDICERICHHKGGGCGCGAPERVTVDGAWKMCPACAEEDARLTTLAAAYERVA
jgi:hypothetical protein